MKSALILVTFFSISLANDLFIGEWKEDPYKRENTNNSVLRNQCYYTK